MPSLRGETSVTKQWQLLSRFLRLMKQHTASFNYFVETEIKKVVAAAPNHSIRSEIDANFYLSYVDVYVGLPSIEEDAFTSTAATPFECRLRDCTSSLQSEFQLDASQSCYAQINVLCTRRHCHS